jgi:hypothetical protein
MVEIETAETDASMAAGSYRQPVGAAPSWIAQRRPVLRATLVVLVVTLAGWGLHWWGPLNPEVQISSTGHELEPRSMALTFMATNAAIAPVEITGVAIVPDRTFTNGGILPAATASRGALGNAIGPTIGQALPLTIPGGGHALVNTELVAPDCRPGLPFQPFVVVVQVRTLAGRTMDIVDPTRVTGSCGELLPTGTPPSDPGLSEQAVREAYTLVYDSATPGTTKGDLIDDPHGLDLAVGSATPTAAETISTTRATVSEVSFDRPDHAWVRYDLTGPSVPGGRYGSIGEAVRVAGTWKVSRASICRDLGLTGVSCPP